MSPSAQRRPSRAARPRKAEAGFTILETVIALFVAMVVGFGAIGLFLFSASFNAGASDRARALAIAQETMEEVRAKSFSDAALTLNTTTTTTVTRGSDAAGESDLRRFTVVKKVEPGGTTSPANREKKITVTVTPVALEGRFSPGAVTLLMVRTSDAIGTN
jgi:Tfp pilus assembly protein PilV